MEINVEKNRACRTAFVRFVRFVVQNINDRLTVHYMEINVGKNQTRRTASVRLVSFVVGFI